jgi:DNA-binding response OmpR family regulator
MHRMERASGEVPEDRSGDLRGAYVRPDAVQPAAGRTRILIIGENEAMRQMLVDYLGEHRLGAIGLATPQDVLGTISRFKPELILLDALLEKGDGFHLLRDIRSRSDVPIIVITHGQRDAVDHIVALELGADDCL